MPRDHETLDENNFMNLTFPIPDNLLVDKAGKPKETLRVTMKANDQGMAPSIFFLRLLDGK